MSSANWLCEANNVSQNPLLLCRFGSCRINVITGDRCRVAVSFLCFVCFPFSMPRQYLMSFAAETVVRPSATELFQTQTPLPDCGTLCCRTSRRRRHCLFFINARKLISSVAACHDLLLRPRSDFRHSNITRSFCLLT